MSVRELADEFAENGLHDVAEYLREHGVADTRVWIEGRIAEAREEDRLYHRGEGWELGNLEVARDLLRLTSVKVESKMAEAANADPGARIAAQSPKPYPTTTWEGQVDLTPYTSYVSYQTGKRREVPLTEAAFRFFNRVERADERRLLDIGYDLPSLSVGDLLTLDGETWEVAPMGFTKVER
jgi:hypothetical protein